MDWYRSARVVVAHHSDDLTLYFNQFGELSNSYVIYDPHTGESKSRPRLPEFGYVEFVSEEDSIAVLKQNSHYILKKQVSVQLTKNQLLTNENNYHDRNLLKNITPENDQKSRGWFPPQTSETSTDITKTPYGTLPIPGYSGCPFTAAVDSRDQANLGDTREDASQSSHPPESPDHNLWTNICESPDDLHFRIEPERLDYRYRPQTNIDAVQDNQVFIKTAKMKRLYKLFYKQLKRPHIKARMVRRQDCNYQFHLSRFVPTYLSRFVNPMAPIPMRLP